MAKRRPGKKGVRRFFKAAVILAMLIVVGIIGWHYLVPVLTENSITLYDSYTVEMGDVETALSFSATLEVKNSKTYTSSEMTKVKGLYVANGDAVKEGDPLVLLSDGELFTASFDGVVNEIRVSIGDWVRPNFSVVQICDLVHLQVTMNVDEYDVKSLTVGQPCTVSVISLGINFETAIGHVNRVSASSGTLAYYTVTCDLTVPGEVLPGMRATVSIPSQSVKGVAVLAMAALAFDEDDSAYTLRLNANGAYEKQYVETGLSDGMQAEITSGVSVGDTVYAVSGTQSATAGFSLEDVYRALAGEKVVINQTSGQQAGAMQMPADFNGQFPAGSDSGGTTDSSYTFADMPQGMQRDTSAAPPADAQQEESAGTSAVTAQPEATTTP